METYIIKVNGKTYEVEVSKKNETEAAVSAGAAQAQGGAQQQNIRQNDCPVLESSSSEESKADEGLPVTAGTSGKIWKISTQKGEMLKKGDTILILEAMKMEIPVVAPEDGRLERISVSEGDTVEAGQIVAVMA